MQNAVELMEVKRKVFATGETVHRDLTVKLSSGSFRVYELIAKPLRNAGGEMIGVITVARDNTTRKEVEMARKESEDRFRLLFEAIPEGALLLDAEGRILMVNSEAERILGFSRKEMLGKTSSELRWKTVREDGSDFPFKEHPAFVALHTAQPVRGIVAGVFQPGHNRCRWIRINAQPWFRAGMAAPFQVYMTFVDIKSFRPRPDTCIKQDNLS